MGQRLNVKGRILSPLFLLCEILPLFCFAIQVQTGDTVEAKSLQEAQGKRKPFQETVSRNSLGREAVVTHLTLGMLQETVSFPSLETIKQASRGHVDARRQISQLFSPLK